MSLDLLPATIIAASVLLMPFALLFCDDPNVCHNPGVLILFFCSWLAGALAPLAALIISFRFFRQSKFDVSFWISFILFFAVTVLVIRHQHFEAANLKRSQAVSDAYAQHALMLQNLKKFDAVSNKTDR